MAALLALGTLMMPAAAQAAPGNNVCTGHVLSVPLAPSADDQTLKQFEYHFGCQDAITAYSVITNNEVQQFDTDTQVFDGTGALIQNEAFNCEGDIPGFGINCNGTYTGSYHLVKGNFLLANNGCSAPRLEPQLVVSYASADSKGVVTNQLAGPFDLGPLTGCPRAVAAKHGKRHGKGKKGSTGR